MAHSPIPDSELVREVKRLGFEPTPAQIRYLETDFADDLGRFGEQLGVDKRRQIDQSELANALLRAGLEWRMTWVGEVPEIYTLELYRREGGEVVETAEVRNGDDNLVSELVDMVVRATAPQQSQQPQ